MGGALIAVTVVAMPVPLSPNVKRGFTGSLLVTESDAANAPIVEGANVTLREQFVPGVRVPVQVPAWTKSGPASATLNVRGAVPVLDKVNVCGRLVVATP